MSSNIPCCVWPCFILSCCAVLILPIWGYMLFNHSMSFEIPTRQKTRAGWSCVFATVLYIATGVYCLFRIIQGQKESLKFRVNRNAYTSTRQQVEMKPLLDDHSSSDNSEIGRNASMEQDPKDNPSGHTNVTPRPPPHSPFRSDRNTSQHNSPIIGQESSRSSITPQHREGSQSSKDSPGTWRSPGRWSDAKASRRVYYEDLPA